MSVAAPSPLCGKRHLDLAEDHSDTYSPFSTSKRVRIAHSPVGRCCPLSERLPGAVGHSAAFAALQGLFPRMDEQVISKVLSEHGSDIDAAVRKLNELQLSMEANGGPSTDAASAAPDTAPAALDAWVESLLQQLSSVTDMDAARAKATETLSALVASTGASGEVARLRAQLMEAGKENNILKRAVAIQANRLQEIGSKDAEIASLRQLAAQYQEKIHALEMSNYSLALHLKRATDQGSAALQAHRHPDVC